MQERIPQEANAFEDERKMIDMVRKEVTAWIADELAKERPDMALVKNLRFGRMGLWLDVAVLQAGDDATVARFHARYGEALRLWRRGLGAPTDVAVPCNERESSLERIQKAEIDFLCARDGITDFRGILSGEIYREAAKPVPDATRLERLKAEGRRLSSERAELRFGDAAGVARVNSKYGAKIRAWRAWVDAPKEAGDASDTVPDFLLFSEDIQPVARLEQPTSRATVRSYEDTDTKIYPVPSFVTREMLQEPPLAPSAERARGNDRAFPTITESERPRRQDAVDFARANVGLEGFVLSEEVEAHAARFIAGEIALDEFVMQKPCDASLPGEAEAAGQQPQSASLGSGLTDDSATHANSHRRETTAVEQRRRQEAVDFARASLWLSGFTVSKQAEELSRRYVAGEITLEEVIRTMDADALRK